MGLMSQFSGPLIGSFGLIYAKSRTWCHAFQPFRDHYQYFCQFLFAVFYNCVQNQVFHSIIAVSNNIGNKQSSQSPAYSQVIKHFRRECLWHHIQESIKRRLKKIEDLFFEAPWSLLSLNRIYWWPLNFPKPGQETSLWMFIYVCLW